MGLWDKIKGKVNEVTAPKPEEEEEKEEAQDEDGDDAEAAFDDNDDTIHDKEKKDYTNSEGMSFNDDEDESAMYVDMGDGRQGFKPDFHDWDPQDWDTYWERHFALEAAQEQGDDAYAAKLAEFGLRNKNHWYRVRETFNVHYQKDPAFMQAAYNARGRQGKQMLQNAAAATGGKLLEPIDGVDVKTYATIQSRMGGVAAGGVAAVGKLLAEYGLDDARWRAIDAGWQKRMQEQDDPMASMALMSEYGAAFAAAGQGQFGAAAAASAGGIGMGGAVGQAPSGGEPCTFDRYVEIMTAQGCWAEQGKDVNALLKQVFNMTAMDWGNLGAYWSQRIGADYTLALQMSEIEQKYKPKYSAGGGADDDLSV
jgi:hypothetical protein